ncbi:MAG: amidohydrolase family protein [Acidimicrobiia bacterium]|nr:amidohydrolase family protein [Acidimicrobiia bacterium]
MSFPTDLGVIDTMLGIPSGDRTSWYKFLRPQLRDRESLDELEMPAGYMFNDVPGDFEGDPVDAVVAEMDHYGIAQALVGWRIDGPEPAALARFPDRFLPCASVDPNRGMAAVADLKAAATQHGVVAAQWFPAGGNPQVPINDKRAYPIYAACCELEIPIFVCCGVPGPRVPMACQHVELIDEVCWFFPELTFVMRHGAEPWEELAVKLMIKWPNLYYSTSAFAPRYYPKAIVDYANTRGADKVLYGGYFPMGLSLERIFAELPQVPFRDEVWPKFLRHNAEHVLGLTSTDQTSR